MKKIILSTLIILSVVSFSIAQTCQLKVGMKFTFETSMYPSIVERDGAKFVALKQKAKDKEIAEYKKLFEEGKIAAKSVNPLVFTIPGITPEGDYEFIQTLSDNRIMKSYLACKDNNFYVMRTKGPFPLVSKNDTIGHYSYGAQIIPMNLKVGDFTPGYIDEMVTTNSGQSTYRSSFFTSSGNYNYSGSVPATYTFDVTLTTLKFYQGGNVIAEDKITISGKEYKCFVVSTEMWTKSDSKSIIEFEKKNYFNDPVLNKKINKQVEKSFEKGGKKLATNMNLYTGANDQGYIVTYKEEWVIPGLTIAKTINYDVYGCVQSIIILKSIE